MTAPRLAALAASQQQQLELLERARLLVAGTDTVPTLQTAIAMILVLIELLDVRSEEIATADQLLDSKDLQINELHDTLADLTERLGHQRDAIFRYQADLRTLRDENLVTERALTAEREKTAGLLAMLPEYSLPEVDTPGGF